MNRSNGFSTRTAKVSSTIKGGLKVINTDASNGTELAEDLNSQANMGFNWKDMAMSVNGQPCDANTTLPSGVMIVTITEATNTSGAK